MAKVIIAIHGRSNKPKSDTLEKGWRNAIEEGLSENTGQTLPNLELEMAYYADIYFQNGPIADNENKEPYIKAENGAIKTYQASFLSRVRSGLGNWVDTPIDWLEEHSHIFSSLGRAVAEKVLKDLGEYYSNAATRTKINNRLKSLLLEHQQDEIILISHSMGTIVAYEVLRELGKSREHATFTLEHFITMGAPLGLTVVKGNILDHHDNTIRTPSCVKGSWVNFSDPQDFVCLDSHLADDFSENSSNIKVKDIMVCNDYPNNAHKSYGYLRTPEFSQHLSRLI